MIEIEVPLGDRSYPVRIDRGDLSGLGASLRAVSPARRVVVVTEDTVGPLWVNAAVASLGAAGIAAEVVTLPAGEGNKTVATWATCVDALLHAGVDRRTPVVALGGGVLGDIVGFASASVLRGVPFVQVPTTLLAMVDSSVGGKTAVNHPRGKNLVGAFHQPILVHAALGCLATLPAAERRAGLGEVVKTALLGDAALFATLEADAEALAAGDPAALAPVVARCVAIKADVVGRDEREGGWRAVLNAGHTVGHAYESACGYGVLRHGEAVALGLVAETAWAVREGICTEADLPGRLSDLLRRLSLPTAPPRASTPALLAAMGVDKKVLGDMLVLPVPVRVGRMVLLDLPVERASELLPERG